MVATLEFIFSSPWTFVGTCVLMLIASLWTPISIRHSHGEDGE